ncbi:MAG: tetratricopeptide repeat protein [Candidatus Firestonebacteria bacterium]|nr:tetratricopeptide repeat protein [Candidatus Firestonebacteria bacterium]
MKKTLAFMFISLILAAAGERGDAFVKGHEAETSEEAIKWYKKALSLCGETEKEPKAWAYNNIGFVYIKDSKWVEALEWFEKAVKEDENNYNAWNNMGIVYENIGYEEQRKGVKSKKRIKNAGKPVTSEADIYPETEYLHKALEAYKKCIKIKPEEQKFKINKLRVESLLQVK